jgi:hypothetical protein
MPDLTFMGDSRYASFDRYFVKVLLIESCVTPSVFTPFYSMDQFTYVFAIFWKEVLINFGAIDFALHVLLFSFV